MVKEEDYVTLDVAMLLTENDYNEISEDKYRVKVEGSEREELQKLGISTSFVVYPKPTLAEVAKWLREKHNISVEPYTNASGYCWQMCKAHKDCTCGTWIDDFTRHEDDKLMNDGGSYDTYEQALNSGIKEALKMI